MRITALILLTLLVASCEPTTDPTPTAVEPPLTADDGTAGVTATSPSGDVATVSHVFDGDSLIAIVDGQESEIRLLGVNAPEGSECHGDVARSTLEQLLESGEITLVADGEHEDQFGRLLRYIYVDGLNVNLALIANGDATTIQGDHSLDTEFATVADAAAAAGLGMWADDACGSSNPPDHVKIADYVYNPSGRDSENSNGEWIAIANTADESVDLGGWILRDESTQHRFVFPEVFTLGPAQEVLVHSGCGADGTSDLYWCAGDPVWSNGGDTVILQLADGTVVARDRFSGDS